MFLLYLSPQLPLTPFLYYSYTVLILFFLQLIPSKGRASPSRKSVGYTWEHILPSVRNKSKDSLSLLKRKTGIGCEDDSFLLLPVFSVCLSVSLLYHLLIPLSSHSCLVLLVFSLQHQTVSLLPSPRESYSTSTVRICVSCFGVCLL